MKFVRFSVPSEFPFCAIPTFVRIVLPLHRIREVFSVQFGSAEESHHDDFPHGRTLFACMFAVGAVAGFHGSASRDAAYAVGLARKISFVRYQCVPCMFAARVLACSLAQQRCVVHFNSSGVVVVVVVVVVA